MVFESKELMFSLALDESDPNEAHAVLRFEGCPEPTLNLVFGSCWTTQKTHVAEAECQAGPGKFRVAGVDGLKDLQEALKQMLKGLKPVEKEFRRQEKAAALQGKASESSAKKSKATKSPAKKATKTPGKKR
jgi:hypothetical protein